MNPEQAVTLLKALGEKQFKVTGNWVTCSCPLAKWLHKSGTDGNPSFGVSVDPHKKPRFHCFSCTHGSLEDLVQTMELYSHNDYKTYDFKTAHQLLVDDLDVMPLPAYSEFNKKEQEFEEWPQYWLDSFKSAGQAEFAKKYLESRNVCPEVWKKHDLRFDSKRQMVVAPYWNVFGKFAGARGRSILSDVKGNYKHHDYTWNNVNNAKLVWYNEPVLQMDGPVVVVEGQFDCWRVGLVYPKVVANLTSKPSMDKMKKLGGCSYIIHIPDTDKPGQDAKNTYVGMCKTFGIGYKCIDIPTDTPEEKIDPDMCHPDYLKERIEELL